MSVKYAFIAILLVISSQADVCAQYAGAFSRIGFGARGISMGNAMAADIFSGTSPYYNPAHAPLAEGQHLEASVATLSFDRSLQFLQLGARLQDKAGFAVGIIHASVTEIDGRDRSGFHTRDLTVDEYAGYLSFGLRFSHRFSAGINLQLFRTDLFEGLSPARSIGVDIGFAARITENWAMGLVFDDLLARYSWDSSDLGSGGRTVTDSFPRRVRLGLTTRQFKGQLLVSAEIESRTSSVDITNRITRIFGDSPAQTLQERNLKLQESRIRFGAEYIPLDGFALRAGLEQLGGTMLDSVRPSLGFKADQDVGDLLFRIEYAFAYETRAAGKMHLLSIKLFL